jgi:hypothetical protein
MGYYTSYNGRRALGMRYSRPPELVLDEERLAQEYAQLPSKRALAEQQRQFNLAQEQQKDAQKKAGVSNLVGTAGNLGMMYYMGKSGMFGNTTAVAPQVVNTAAPAAAQQTTQLLGQQTVQNASTAVPMTYGTQIATPVTQTAGTVVPATEGMAATGVLGDSGSLAGVTAESLEGTSVTGSGVGMGATSVGGAILPGVGAGLVAGQLGKSGTGQDIGKALMFNRGGEKENAAVAGGVGGALGGALAGAAATSWSGPGAIVGAVVGGVVGAASSLIDTHICTATNKVVGISVVEAVKMKVLKEYAIENHAGWWNSYFKYGPQLISAITEKENNLSEFYQMIRLVLIEPVSHETDMERCFQIYLGITKMLFMAYMPEFKFGEEA